MNALVMTEWLMLAKYLQLVAAILSNRSIIMLIEIGTIH